MFYRAQEVEKMWDTYGCYHEGVFYMYYMDDFGHREEGPNKGISLATSPNGVHWKEYGLVIPIAKDAKWLGDGTIWKSPLFDQDGQFFTQFSEWRGPDRAHGKQSMFFAASTDLIKWKRLGDEYRFSPDPRWYRNDPDMASRWDSICTMQRDGGGLYGYWTATPKTHAGIGFGQTFDGLRFEVLEPPRIEWGDIPAMNWFEIGGMNKINDKFYALMGHIDINHKDSDGITPDTVGGMYTFIADRPEGPFRPASKNFELLTWQGHLSTYYTRYFHSPDGLLINHHATNRDNITFLSPLKRAITDRAGTLRLGYWEGNEKVKGKEIKVKATQDNTVPRKARDLQIDFLNQTFDLTQGIVIEGAFEQLPNHEKKDSFAGAGFYIEEKKEAGIAILVQNRSVTEFGHLSADGSDYESRQKIDRQLDIKTRCNFRLMIRQTLSELYIDDLLVQCYSLSPEATGRIGLVFGAKGAKIEDLRVWAMNFI